MVNHNKFCGQLPATSGGSSSLFSKDGNPTGNRNGSSLNNAGEWGNYWSSSPNESNSENAYNLNFNSSNHNVDWNNRYNGKSVRPVSEFTQPQNKPDGARHFSITPEQLLVDLVRAYKNARQHKRSKAYQLKFELNLEDNLAQLRDELLSQTYCPQPSICFIIHDPKMREVFAADFRDRIVHHLFYNYTHSLFERQFISDSYSCIKGRGTHYGIRRLQHHIRSASQNYRLPCYVLKIDIRGYFMHINRDILLQLCRQSLHKAKNIDNEFVDYLLEIIVTNDPTENCIRIGDASEWAKLPTEKSIFNSAEHCGLPIGNLSSQLFSNVYLNQLDQFVKRTLHCRHYGRYVDDAYIVGHNRQELKALVAPIEQFIANELHLHLNPQKTQICDVRQGVEFLGAYIKPYRTYVANRSLRRIERHLKHVGKFRGRELQSRVNSLLGVVSHYASFRLRRVLFGFRSGLHRYGNFSSDLLKFYPQ